MRLPNLITHGSAVKASDFNAMVQFLRSLQLSGGPGVLVRRSSAGTTVMIPDIPQGSSGGSAQVIFPFQVSDASTATAANVSVRAGSVNDVVPSGIAPSLQSFTAAGTWAVYLEATLNGAGTVTGVTVGVASGSQPADTDTTAHITLATVSVVALSGDSGFKVSAINQLATHSLRFFACGRVASGETVTTRGSFNFWGF